MNNVLDRIGLRNRIKELERQNAEMSIRLSGQSVNHQAELLEMRRTYENETVDLKRAASDDASDNAKLNMKTEQQRILILALQDELKDIDARQSYQRVEQES